jgi:cardiolipin synthase
MSDWISVLWGLLISGIHFGCAIGVTLHAILQRQQSKAAVAWIGLAWLAPFVGAIAYACLGINRITRKGSSLGFDEARREVAPYEPSEEDLKKLQSIAEAHPALVGLARLGRSVSDRRILPGNKVDPLVNGDEAYPAMLRAIDEAQTSVALLSYIFDSDRAGEQFLEALVRACERGVEVRVLIDHVGSRYSKPNMVGRLRKAGVPVAAFLPPGKAGLFRFANLRNHRKILVTDGRIGFTGGTNIREGHCMDLKPSFPVQCLHFRFEGPVAAHLMEAFAIDWAFASGERLEGETWFRPVERSGVVGARGISDGPDEDLDKLEQVLLGALAAACRRVRIVTPYFLPDDTLRWALAVAAMQNVEVDIVLPERNNIRVMDWASVPQMPFLLEKGCRVHLTPEPFDHTKLMVVDGVWSLVGSTNWDARSLRLNFEYNIECYDEELAGRLDRIVEEKIAAARPVTLEEVSNRSAPIRVRDGLAQLLSPYL